MRRADRLFQIVQLLRRDRITTAARLAGELGVSERTLYRDIADLMKGGVPIESEAGVGYRLPRHFDLPPLMFTVDEAEALALGLRIAAAWADPALAEAARAAERKLGAVLPAKIREALADSELHAPDFHVPAGLTQALEVLRRGIRERRYLDLDYRDADGAQTRRTVRPLALHFWGGTWTLAAWCETRRAFRTFRTDRMAAWELQANHYPREAGRELEDYLVEAGAS